MPRGRADSYAGDTGVGWVDSGRMEGSGRLKRERSNFWRWNSMRCWAVAVRLRVMRAMRLRMRGVMYFFMGCSLRMATTSGGVS